MQSTLDSVVLPAADLRIVNDLLAVPQTSERKKKILYTDGEVRE